MLSFYIGFCRFHLYVFNALQAMSTARYDAGFVTACGRLSCVYYVCGLVATQREIFIGKAQLMHVDRR